MKGYLDVGIYLNAYENVDILSSMYNLHLHFNLLRPIINVCGKYITNVFPTYINY